MKQALLPTPSRNNTNKPQHPSSTPAFHRHARPLDILQSKDVFPEYPSQSLLQALGLSSEWLFFGGLSAFPHPETQTVMYRYTDPQCEATKHIRGTIVEFRGDGSFVVVAPSCPVPSELSQQDAVANQVIEMMDNEASTSSAYFIPNGMTVRVWFSSITQKHYISSFRVHDASQGAFVELIAPDPTTNHTSLCMYKPSFQSIFNESGLSSIVQKMNLAQNVCYWFLVVHPSIFAHGNPISTISTQPMYFGDIPHVLLMDVWRTLPSLPPQKITLFRTDPEFAMWSSIVVPKLQNISIQEAIDFSSKTYMPWTLVWEGASLQASSFIAGLLGHPQSGGGNTHPTVIKVLSHMEMRRMQHRGNRPNLYARAIEVWLQACVYNQSVTETSSGVMWLEETRLGLMYPQIVSTGIEYLQNIFSVIVNNKRYHTTNKLERWIISNCYSRTPTSSSNHHPHSIITYSTIINGLNRINAQNSDNLYTIGCHLVKVALNIINKNVTSLPPPIPSHVHSLLSHLIFTILNDPNDDDVDMISIDNWKWSAVDDEIPDIIHDIVEACIGYKLDSYDVGMNDGGDVEQCVAQSPENIVTDIWNVMSSAQRSEVVTASMKMYRIVEAL